MTYAHKIVAQTAMEMAQAVYEQCAKDDGWYAANRNRKAFVRELAPKLIPQARGMLAEMLAQPGRSEREKEQIMEALVQDRTIPRGAGTTIQ